VAKPKRLEASQLQRPAPQAFPIAAPISAGFSDMAERVGAFVAIGASVGGAAATHGIKNDENCAGHAPLTD
jgi:hypothetical protein